MFVWNAMPSMMAMMSEILCEAASISRMVETTCSISLPLRAATLRVCVEICCVSCALVVVSCTDAVSWAMDASAVSSVLAAFGAVAQVLAALGDFCRWRC